MAGCRWRPASNPADNFRWHSPNCPWSRGEIAHLSIFLRARSGRTWCGDASNTRLVSVLGFQPTAALRIAMGRSFAVSTILFPSDGGEGLRDEGRRGEQHIRH